MARDLEVYQLHATVVAQEDVAGLDVAVHNAHRRGVDEPLHGVFRYAERLVDVKAQRRAREPVLQRLALQELLHDDMHIYERPFREASVVLDHVRMGQRDQLVRPPLEPPPLVAILVLRRHDLEGDLRADLDKAVAVVLADRPVHRALATGRRA